MVLFLVEFLDEEEFGGTSETITSNESSTGPAVELGLMVGFLSGCNLNSFRTCYEIPLTFTECFRRRIWKQV